MLPKYWEIIPYIGVGPLRFGFNRDEIKSIMKISPLTFMKGGSTEKTDAYDELGLHLYFGDKRLECIEAFGPCEIYFQKLILLNRNANEVIKDLTNLGLRCRDDDGYFFDDSGFVLYESCNVVKAVTSYKRGYYDLSAC